MNRQFSSLIAIHVYLTEFIENCSDNNQIQLKKGKAGATDFKWYPGIFLNYGSIWWLEKEMNLNLFIATKLNLI